MIPENIRTTIFKKFFDENDQPIITKSQYHTELMWTHIEMVYDAWKELFKSYEELFTTEEKKIAKWGVLLHDIGKPDTIVEKYRKICPKCHRPNVPEYKARKVKACLECKSDDLVILSDKWQQCNDCSKKMVRELEAKVRTNCYMCDGELPEEVILNHGWHNHDKIGGTMEYLAPILEQIGLTGNTDVVKLVRCHSIVHAKMHQEFQSDRASAEESKQVSHYENNLVEEFGADPFKLDFEESLMAMFGNKKVAMMAILLSAADDRGKTTPIIEEGFTDEFIDGLIERIKNYEIKIGE